MTADDVLCLDNVLIQGSITHALSSCSSGRTTGNRVPFISLTTFSFEFQGLSACFYLSSFKDKRG